MSWIKSQEDLEKHPKLHKLMQISGLNKFESIGLLHCFWWWVLNYAENGDLSNFKDSDFSLYLGYTNNKSINVLQLLITSGFVDDTFRVHNWLKHNYDYFYRKYHTSNKNKWDLLTKEYSLYLGNTKVYTKNRQDKIRLDKIRLDKIRLDKIRLDKIREDKDKYLTYVYLTKREHEDLVQFFGESGTKEKIQALNDYLGSKGKKYKSHYHTILNWDNLDRKKRGEPLLDKESIRARRKKAQEFLNEMKGAKENEQATI